MVKMPSGDVKIAVERLAQTKVREFFPIGNGGCLSLCKRLPEAQYQKVSGEDSSWQSTEIWVSLKMVCLQNGH